MGRPSTYDTFWSTETGMIAIMTWARAGLTESDIASKMGISTTTLDNWKARYPDFLGLFKKDKEVADLIVQNALYKRAIGYDYDEVTKERAYNEYTKEYEMVVTKIVTKHVYPDTTAQRIWLYNRQREQWGERVNEPTDSAPSIIEDDSKK